VYGQVTSLVAELLEGAAPDDVSRRHALAPNEVDAVMAALRAKRLVR
jgi:hypothetical protein